MLLPIKIQYHLEGGDRTNENKQRGSIGNICNATMLIIKLLLLVVLIYLYLIFTSLLDVN